MSNKVDIHIFIDKDLDNTLMSLCTHKGHKSFLLNQAIQQFVEREVGKRKVEKERSEMMEEGLKEVGKNESEA